MGLALALAWQLASASAGPPADSDQAAQISAAFQAAEALQGPLDGVWRLSDRAGRTLYVFALADPGSAPAPLASDPLHPGVEGAWRDPARTSASGGSGFIDTVADRGGRVRIGFCDGQAEAVTLRAAGAGRWTGALTRAGRRRAVVMTRF